MRTAQLESLYSLTVKFLLQFRRWPLFPAVQTPIVKHPICLVTIVAAAVPFCILFRVDSSSDFIEYSYNLNKHFFETVLYAVELVPSKKSCKYFSCKTCKILLKILQVLH